MDCRRTTRNQHARSLTAPVPMPFRLPSVVGCPSFHNPLAATLFVAASLPACHLIRDLQKYYHIYFTISRGIFKKSLAGCVPTRITNSTFSPLLHGQNLSREICGDTPRRNSMHTLHVLHGQIRCFAVGSIVQGLANVRGRVRPRTPDKLFQILSDQVPTRRTRQRTRIVNPLDKISMALSPFANLTR